MPLLGEGHSDLVGDEAPYFRSLAELDTWFASNQPHDKLSGVVPYQPRPYADSQSDSEGKLLVCHDYKATILNVTGQGGYTELPSGLCYTFNFWRLCDTFVYFSHNRVTVPPSGWANTAHKQGARILGTLIFEGRANPDCVQLLVGCAEAIVMDNKIPISKRYAVLLAELAYQRGFDGYLLNFESHLKHGIDHAHALAAWILLLKAELRAKVGPHAQVVWYDSVIYNGRLSYQNRLNGYNLPFFLASDAFFTNYWWFPQTQTSMVEYFETLKGAIPNPDSLASSTSSAATKHRQDIYSGVDVFPRNGGFAQYGYGFVCYRAINHTSPLGLSTALFAPGWTWEEETQKAEENWDTWWANERKLWLGPLKPGDIIHVPDPWSEGPFKPMTAFFRDLPPPDPYRFAFYTNFSPGVGYSWFVEGKKVLNTKKGWTDIDKQCSIGNLVWPWPTPSWQGNVQDEIAPTASSALDMTDGYNGGNALKLTVACKGSEAECIGKVIWLPVQSLTVTARESFEARVIYKATALADDVDPEFHIYAKPLSEENDGIIHVSETNVADLPQGWTAQTLHFTSSSAESMVSVGLGFLIDIKTKDSSANVTFSFSLGQLAVYPIPPPETVSVGSRSITDAKFSLHPHATNIDALHGVLTWDIASTFPSIDAEVDDEESITPAWLLQDTPACRFPKFAYFNIYVEPLDGLSSTEVEPTGAVFVGTTGLDGRANRFYVEPACLPSGSDDWAGIRFYVQGVTDHGEVLPWGKCASVDFKRSKA